MFKKRASRLAAFTLLEVLIVTGIMTSQANNYGNVKKIAYQSACRNNLDQLYKALLMYDMSNGSLPNAAFYPKHPLGGPRSLVKILGSAYKETLVCPVFPSTVKNAGLTYISTTNFPGSRSAPSRTPTKPGSSCK